MRPGELEFPAILQSTPQTPPFLALLGVEEAHEICAGAAVERRSLARVGRRERKSAFRRDAAERLREFAVHLHIGQAKRHNCRSFPRQPARHRFQRRGRPLAVDEQGGERSEFSLRQTSTMANGAGTRPKIASASSLFRSGAPQTQSAVRPRGATCLVAGIRKALSAKGLGSAARSARSRHCGSSPLKSAIAYASTCGGPSAEPAITQAPEDLLAGPTFAHFPRVEKDSAFGPRRALPYTHDA